MGKIESEDKKVICLEHSDNQTIWECDSCGKKMCKDCKAVGFQYKIYCEKCIEKVETTPLGKTIHPAPPLKRFGGFVIDTIVMLFLYLIFFSVSFFFFTPILVASLINIAFIFYLIYFIIFTCKAGQTPGQMAMEIEVKTATNRKPNIIQSLMRHLIGGMIGFFYCFGLITYLNKLMAGMGTQHFTTVFEFLSDYHRFGISDNMKFFYVVLFIFIFIDSFFILLTKNKTALHDLWSRTKVSLSL